MTVFRSRRVVTPEGVRAATVHVTNGVIAAVRDYQDVADDHVVVEAHDAYLIPGLVDTHVHINEPGRTEWEGFATATAAAAAGGVTTLIDMPLNSVPATTSVTALYAKGTAADGQCAVDVAFWGGLVPDNITELSALADAGVPGFKCFLVPSGVPEFAHVGADDLRRALPVLAELRRPLLVHAESPAVIDAAIVRGGEPRSYARYLATRPARAELAAVMMLVELAEQYGAQVHVVHVSAAATIPLICAARERGVKITAETCPHYLHFMAEAVPDGATEFKCAPPIREAANREQLWQALSDGELDFVVSDHSPCPPALKQRETGSFDAAWGGIASLQLRLSIVWTGARQRGISIVPVMEWLASAPARLAQLDSAKGRIAVGYDADLVIFDPNLTWTVDAAQLHHRHAVTPYAGARLHGVVLATYLRGENIFEADRLVGARRGRILKHQEASWTSPS